MRVVLFDTILSHNSLYPFTMIRPVADMRVGIFKIKERWSFQLHQDTAILCDPYLNPSVIPDSPSYLYIDASLFPDTKLTQAILALQPGEGLIKGSIILAVHSPEKLNYGFSLDDCTEISMLQWPDEVMMLNYSFEIIQFNARQLKEDIELLVSQKLSQPISVTNHVSSPEQIFIEEGAVAEHCFLNANDGPIYIGKNCLVMEGSLIRGPFAALENSVVKMGSTIYGATTVGKHCTVGGEIKNTVFFDYSNKAHHGYIGDAVIGDWCNIGAGTSCSNIKNTAGNVKIWNRLLHQWIDAGMKCGVMMGDYTHTAINTSLNTGTVTGVCCNIFNNGFAPKYIPDFTWNCASSETYIYDKAIKDISNWMHLKHKELTSAEQQILLFLYSKKS